MRNQVDTKHNKMKGEIDIKLSNDTQQRQIAVSTKKWLTLEFFLIKMNVKCVKLVNIFLFAANVRDSLSIVSN
jgi:hypothetical protein